MKKHRDTLYTMSTRLLLIAIALIALTSFTLGYSLGTNTERSSIVIETHRTSK
ncbi:MAG: hypothetical protein Q8P93_04580 [bacterium]|nr:hypothetical protein [bacterium]